MSFIKSSKELCILSINDLILLYFDSLDERRNPHVKFDGENPYLEKENYSQKCRKQSKEILNVLRNKGVPINYFYLKFKQFKIRFFRS